MTRSVVLDRPSEVTKQTNVLAKVTLARWLTAVWQELKKRPRLKTSMAVALTACGLLLSRVLYKKVWAVARKSPPQLYGLPFIGSVGTLILWGQNFGVRLLPKYGDLVTYQLGTHQFYKINDADLATKILNVAADRPSFFRIVYEIGQKPAHFGSVNEDLQWGYRRRKFMRDLGTVLNGKQVNENISKILQTMTFAYLEDAKSKSCKSDDDQDYVWYPRECLRHLTLNSIFLAVFDKTLDINSKLFADISTSLSAVPEKILAGFLYSMLPKFIAEPIFGTEYKLFLNANDFLYKLAQTELNKVIMNPSKISKQRDHTFLTLTDLYAADETLSADQKVADVVVALLGGTDTTSHTSEVGLLLLAQNPREQELIYQELKANAVIGDKKNNLCFELLQTKYCPLLKAFVQETLRIARTGANAVLRTCSKDIRCLKLIMNDDSGARESKIICDVVDSKVWKSYDDSNNNYVHVSIEYDYIIEKNTIIEPNLLHISVNDKNWSLDNDGQKMNLDYWLTNSGSKNGDEKKVKFVRNKASLPFGAGARECPGQSLALKQLYAFFGNLLLMYEIQSVGALEKIPIQYPIDKASATVCPQIPVRIRKRHE